MHDRSPANFYLAVSWYYARGCEREKSCGLVRASCLDITDLARSPTRTGERLPGEVF